MVNTRITNFLEVITKKKKYFMRYDISKNKGTEVKKEDHYLVFKKKCSFCDGTGIMSHTINVSKVIAEQVRKALKEWKPQNGYER